MCAYVFSAIQPQKKHSLNQVNSCDVVSCMSEKFPLHTTKINLIITLSQLKPVLLLIS